MTRSRFRAALLLSPLLLAPPLLGCGDDTNGGGDTGVADTEVADTADTTEPDTTEPDTTEPDTTEPDTTEPDTADTIDTTGPDTSEPDTADTAEPDTADTADTAEPDTADTTEPDTTEPDTTPTVCTIDGVTWASGDRDPTNLCAACDPASSVSAWTPSAGTFTLLNGALDHTTQGWALASQAPFSATLVDDALELRTSTQSGSPTSGMALLWRSLPIPAGAPFTFEVELRLDAASRHNPFDAGAAILASYTPNFGTASQRGQMIYLETDGLGWADDSASASLAIADGSYNTFRVSVDASGLARVAVDGVERLTRSGFTSNGQIAIGDQTNDANVDGTMRIRAVRLLCP